MAAQYTIRESTKADAYWVASRLREEDQEEIEASGCDPLDTLLRGVEQSYVCITACVANPETGRMEPAVMFGAGEVTGESEVACPWMLCTDLINGLGLAIVRESRKWVKTMGKVFPVLTNYVYMENHQALRWLQMMGFSFPDPPVHHAVTGERFLRFEMRKDEPCAE